MPADRMPITHRVGRAIIVLVLAALIAGLFWTGVPIRAGGQVARGIADFVRAVWLTLDL